MTCCPPPATHGPAAPSTHSPLAPRRVIRRANQLISQVTKTTTELQLIDLDGKLVGDLEGHQPGSTTRQWTAATLVMGLTGRGGVIAHALPQGGQGMIVKEEGWGKP